MPVKFKVITETNGMRDPTAEELPHIHEFMNRELFMPEIGDYAVGDYDVPNVGLVLFMEQQGNGKPQ